MERCARCQHALNAHHQLGLVDADRPCFYPTKSSGGAFCDCLKFVSEAHVKATEALRR